MAILQNCPGLEIEVVVSGFALKEYSDDCLALPKTVAKYVVTQSGFEFEIRYAFAAPFPSDRPVSMIMTVDGIDLDEPLLRPEELFNSKGHVSAGPTFKVGPRWFVQKFAFSTLTTGEYET